MRPPRRQFSSRLRITALILCGTFALTQAAPAWAIPPVRDTLRPEVSSPPVKSGLEEAFRPSGTVVPTIGHTTALVAGVVAPVVPRVLSEQDRRALQGVEGALNQLPSAKANLKDMVLAGAAYLRSQSVRMAQWLPTDDAITAHLSAVVNAAPPATCVTCGADAVANIVSDPQFALPESKQSPAFNQRERHTAVLILRQLARTGGIAYIERTHGGRTHRVFGDPMTDLQEHLEDMQADVAAPQRLQWQGVTATDHDLDALVQRGFVLAHLDGDHYVRVTGTTPETVTFTEPIAIPAGAVTASRTVSRREFSVRWQRSQHSGVALVGLQPDQSLPHGVGTLKPADLARIVGCCGVVNFPSSVSAEEFALLPVTQRPGVSIEEAAWEAIALLESRGFDNAALLVKYEVRLDQPGTPVVRMTPGLSAWAKTEWVHLVTDDDGRVQALRFFTNSRVTGAATANREYMQQQMQERITGLMTEFVRRFLVAERMSGGTKHLKVEREGLSSADWLVSVERGRVHRLALRVAARGAFLHTRFATKGGYQQANAHWWIEEYEGGIWGLSHNGDWETYDWVRPFLEDLYAQEARTSGEPVRSFEGTTDSTVLLHLLTRVAVTRHAGRVTIEPDDIALQRLFRLIDILEALKALGLQLVEVEKAITKHRGAVDEIAGKLKTSTGESSKALRAEQAEHVQEIRSLTTAVQNMKQLMTGFGFDGEQLAPAVEIGQSSKTKVSRAFIAVLQRALADPGAYDVRGMAENHWHGYLTFTEYDGQPLDPDDAGVARPTGLGGYLAKAAPPAFRKAFWKGLNITIQVASLSSPYGGVLARTHSLSQTTQGNLAVERDAKGKVVRVAAVSEFRGAAPQMGQVKRRFPVRPGIDVVYGTMEGKAIEPWSIYTIDGTTVRRHMTWGQPSEVVDLAKEVSTINAAWIKVEPEGDAEYRRLSPFELEAMVQAATVTATIDVYTKRSGELWLPDVVQKPDGAGLTPQALRMLSDPHTDIVMVGAGSGSSTFTLRIANSKQPMFDTIRASDSVRLRLPPYLASGAKTVLVVVSQSGETGSAITLADQVRKAGGLVIVVTNTPGSTLDRTGRASGGSLRYLSTPESAVAATGTTVHQVVLLRLLGIEARRLRGEMSDEQASEAIEAIRRLGTRAVNDGHVESGTLKHVLDGFFLKQVMPGELASGPAVGLEEPAGHPGEPESFYDKAQHVVEYFQAVAHRAFHSPHPARGVSMRATNVTIIGRGTGQESPEVGLKFVEQTGLPALVLGASEFLELGIGAANGAVDDSFRVVQAPWPSSTVVETIRDTRQRFATLDGLTLTDQPVRRILLVGNGTDVVAMQVAKNEYQHVSPVPIEVMTYEEAAATADGAYVPPTGTLVVFVRPGEAIIAGRPSTDFPDPLARLAKMVIDRWRVPAEWHVSVCSSEATTFAKALRTQVSNIRELSGPAGDRELAVAAAVDRLVANLVVRVLDAPGVPPAVRESGRAYVQDRQGSRDSAVGGGIQRTIEQTLSPEGYNATALARFVAFAKERARGIGGDRGWEAFNFWPAGYGPREWLARDLARLIRQKLGMSSYPEEPSNGSHGYYGAMQPGGEAFVWNAPVGPAEKAAFGEDFEKKLKEGIPRGVNAAFPSAREPGFYLMVGTEADLKEVGIDDMSYRRLRHARAQAEERTPDGKVAMTTPDAVLATPNGDVLEGLVLNRLVVDFLAAQRAKAFKAAGIPWDAPWAQRETQRARRGELVIVVDPGHPGPERREFFQTLRRRYPRSQNTIVLLTSQQAAHPTLRGNDDVDLSFRLPTGDPVEFLATMHGLSAVIARERYASLAARAAVVAEVITDELREPGRGIFGKHDDPQHPQLVGAVEIIRLYAMLHMHDSETLTPELLALKRRITPAIAELQAKHASIERSIWTNPDTVFQLLQDALEIYRVQLVPIFGFAKDPAQLVRYLIFQVQGLAKVVTNLCGIALRPEAVRESPEIVTVRVGAIADGSADAEIAEALRVAAMDDPRVTEAMTSILEYRAAATTTASSPAELAALFWSVVQADLRTTAQQLVSTDSTAKAVPIALGIGYPAAASTDPTHAAIVFDLTTAAIPALMTQVVEDEFRHLHYDAAVRSLPVAGIVLTGISSALAGQTLTLVRQAIAEAVFLLGQADRFSNYTPAQQGDILTALMGYGLPLHAPPAYQSFFGSTLPQNLVRERFWQALAVIAEAPLYRDVGAVAGLLLEQRARFSNGRDNDLVWAAAQPLVSALREEQMLSVSRDPVEQFLDSMKTEGRRRPSEAAIFKTLYESYLERPRPVVSLESPGDDPAGVSRASVLFPYRLPRDTQTLGAALSPRITRYLRTIAKPEHQADPIEPYDVFVYIYHRTPDGQDMAAVVVQFRDNDLAKLAVDFRADLPAATQAITRAVQPYLRPLVSESPQGPSASLDFEALVGSMIRQFQQDGDDHIQLIDLSKLPSASAVKTKTGLEESGAPAGPRVPTVRVLVVGPYREVGTIQSVTSVLTTMFGWQIFDDRSRPPQTVRRGTEDTEVGVLYFDLAGVSYDTVTRARALGKTVPRLIEENLKWGPGAQPVSLIPGQAVPVSIFIDSRLESATLDAETLAVTLAQAGLIGVVPPGTPPAVLQEIADQVDAQTKTWVGHLNELFVSPLTTQSGRRFVSHSIGAHEPVLRVIDHIKGVLSDDRSRSELAKHEAGSSVVVIRGPGAASMGDLNELPQHKWMMLLATHVPPALVLEEQAKFLRGGEYALDPLMPISRVEPVLAQLLRVNGFTTPDGSADWSKLTLVHMANRDYETRYHAAFQVLTARGARVVTPPDGTFSWGVRAGLPPTPDGGLVVEWTLSKLDRAVANIMTAAAGPAGAEVSGSLVSSAAVDDPAARDRATDELPVGSARAFLPAERDAVHRWRAQQDDADALLAGKFLTSRDVQGSVSVTIVPVTTDTAAFGNPLKDQQGIPGLADLGGGAFGLTPIWVHAGHIFVRRTLVEAKPFPPALRFTSPLVAPIPAPELPATLQEWLVVIGSMKAELQIALTPVCSALLQTGQSQWTVTQPPAIESPEAPGHLGQTIIALALWDRPGLTARLDELMQPWLPKAFVAAVQAIPMPDGRSAIVGVYQLGAFLDEPAVAVVEDSLRRLAGDAQVGLEETTTVTQSAAPSAVTISPPVSGTVTLPQTAGVIYGRPEGLAVGLSVALQQGGQAVPSVFVVQNEQEESILRGHGVADTDILRVWQIEGAFDTATARFEAAVQEAHRRLTGRSVQVIQEITQLPIGHSLAEEFLKVAQDLVRSFKIAGVDAQAIADRAQRAAHDLFA